jgi:cobalt-zinc-cadmium efflux system protein
MSHHHHESGREEEPHDHAHGLGGHSHAPANFNRAFAIGTALNTIFVAVEAIYGVSSHSLALLADAGHNLSDVFALLLAWGASALAQSPPTKERTYGWRSTSILAALFNAILLLIAIGAIAWEAIERFTQPSPVAGTTVMWVALIGIFINAATAFLFASGRKGDLNVRGAFFHMAADAAVSLGVVIAGFFILKTGLHWIDPVTSLAIVAVIAVGTWGLLRDSVIFALHAVPPGVSLPEVRAYLASLPGVTEVHDLHIWGMSTTETALTAHLVRADSANDDALLTRATHELRARFKIVHPTIQLETAVRRCELAPADRV